MSHQLTLKQPIEAVGVGVHTGEKVYLTLRPAPVDTGIIFRRIDLDPVVEIPAVLQYVGDTSLCTCLSREGVRIATVEHLLSAFSAFGIDNAYVDVTAAELPIMDGSAAPFVYLIKSAGIQVQSALKRYIRIMQSVRVEEGDKWAAFSPYEGFQVQCEIEFEHPVIRASNQVAVFDAGEHSYEHTVSRARTFGFLSQYEAIRQRNMALGASLENAVVLDEFRVLNQDGLRDPDEFAKHKLLDMMGDVYLLGHALIGKVVGHKSGHTLNSRLLAALLAEESAYEWVTFPEGRAPLCSVLAAQPVVSV
ncbi:MAG: UDP-3-O-[3-hydroxymyristoyl] N-acetylglucosamine deacetylase [Gammaproteobacteria bacterium RIFCSPHIGHO2_12_FULL_45_9]|nr:MAG: UDP-3-O-[3-hydroxymyristoyl] N-acetylglucosamine deacetylase [Gammaproteobacteria bacterium RIFCSPHIGHO2_12_FULL_45_9]